MSDVLKFLSSVPGAVVLIGLLISAALLVVLTNWRLLIFALGVQYLLIGLMLTRVVPLELAAVKALVGVMICPVLFITARRVQWGRVEVEPGEEADATPEKPATPQPPRSRLRRWLGSLISPGLPVRLLATGLTGVLAISLALRNPLQITGDVALSRDLTVATFTLMLLGLLNVMLNENPFKAGLGLLSLLGGFELVFTVIEPTITILGLLGLTNLIIALAISYLTTAWATHPVHEAQS